jgi:hypothetical protein
VVAVDFQASESNIQVLTSLADFRVLTVGQICTLQSKDVQVVRRNLTRLQAAGLIETVPLAIGNTRGRPERVVSLAPRGLKLLHDEGLLPTTIGFDHAGMVAPPLVRHQLLVNWFRVRLAKIPEFLHQMGIAFLCPTSSFTPCRHDGQPIVVETADSEAARGKSATFTPDGVFSITDRERQKTLLFFLEADMGTETSASPSGRGADVRQKIRNYQICFRSERYKRYEKIWNCTLRGFRLLILTSTSARLSALCRLVQETPPSDFIWLTDLDRLLEQGLAAPIWARGGRLKMPAESILGKSVITEVERPQTLS